MILNKPIIKAYLRNVYNLFRALINAVFDFLFPSFCVGCKKEGMLLCPSCESKIDYFTTDICIVCQKSSTKGFTHQTCSTKYTPHRIYCGFLYTGVVRKAILMAKYGMRYKALDPLAEIFIEDIRESGVDFGTDSLVIPIPLHFWRRLSRGYNQAEYIAQKLAKSFNLPLVSSVLKRTIFTKKQAQLTKLERKENVKNAFVVPSNKINQIKGRDIVLVDDIETSGATMLSASRALKLAGCRYIYCVAFSKD
jgi:ComF family protein